MAGYTCTVVFSKLWEGVKTPLVSHLLSNSLGHGSGHNGAERVYLSSGQLFG